MACLLRDGKDDFPDRTFIREAGLEICWTAMSIDIAFPPKTEHDPQRYENKSSFSVDRHARRL